ncbi:MAG TPA: polysaccharide deacetylase family protein [Polyangiaceae bacterium]|nr:polysaccharide deacetylase family protein [Polyangiaceae bacterium]
MRLRSPYTVAVALVVAGCSIDAPSDDGGAAGTPGAAGSSTAGSSSTSAGAASTAGAATSGSSAGGSGGAASAAGASAGGGPFGGAAAGGAAAGGVGNTAGTNSGGTTSGGSASAGPSGLPVPPGAANVPKPSGAGTKITVVHWAGFKGAVSYSFDDNNTSQIQNYSQLNALGVRFTFFMWTGKAEASNAIWKTAYKDGHEIANHTKSHQSAGTADDIQAATTFITQQFGTRPWSLAAPNGAQVYSTLTKGKFFINRGVGNGLIGPGDNSDPFTLPTYIPPTGASTAAFNSEVDSARSAGKWRTMCIHGFTGDGAAYQPVPVDQFIESVKHAKSTGDMWIDTITNVGAYWLGEKAFGAATTMTSGTDKTWTWKLPDQFPTGHYLRVTVDGGTLKQAGNTLNWDPHGYYEIALDAGSVTLSP